MIRRPLLLSLLIFHPLATHSQSKPEACPGDFSAVDLRLPFATRGLDCIRLAGGFSNVAGTFVDASYSLRDLLTSGDTISVSSEYGVRRRRVELGYRIPHLRGTAIGTGFTLYGQRFHYNQERESSLLAFQRDIPEFQPLPSSALINYISHSFGGAAFAEYRIHGSSSRFSLAYAYDVSGLRTLADSTAAYFTSIRFENRAAPESLQGIRTSVLTPSIIRYTVDDPVRPSRGADVFISTAIGGLGGNVNLVEPMVDAAWYHPGLANHHVIAVHFQARLLTGYGGMAAPPFDRFYVGGEADVRGFDSWSISPVIYIPSTSAVNVLHNDGTVLTQTVVIGGVPTVVPITMTVPSYKIVSAGGDTSSVMNLEYRIPIRGPFTVVLFTDAGVNHVTFPSQLGVDQAQIDSLNRQFSAGFTSRPRFQAGTEKLRMSIGGELQVLVPKLNAPLRFYLAYNPVVYRGLLQPPLADLAAAGFPNRATFQNALVTLGQVVPLSERQFMARFSIGHTFGSRHAAR